MTENRRVADEQLRKHEEEEIARYHALEERLLKIEDTLVVTNNTITEIKDIWSQAKGALTLIKVLAGIATAIAAVYAFLNTNFTITPK